MATNGPGVVVTGADLTRGRGCLTSRWPGAGRTLGLEVGGGGWLLQSLTCDAKGGHSRLPSGTFLPCLQRGPWLSLSLPLPVARFTSSRTSVHAALRFQAQCLLCTHGRQGGVRWGSGPT